MTSGIYDRTNSNENTGIWKKGNVPWNKNTKGLMNAWNKGIVKYPNIKHKRRTYKSGRTSIIYERICINCGKIDFVELQYLHNKLCRSCSCKLVRKPMSKETINKIRKKRMEQKNVNKDTKIELKVKEQLSNLNIRFEQQFNLGDKFQCDFYLPKSNIIIECDGDYWHNRVDMKKRDKAKNAYALKCGFNLIRIWEHEINSKDFNVGDYIGI